MGSDSEHQVQTLNIMAHSDDEDDDMSDIDLKNRLHFNHMFNAYIQVILAGIIIDLLYLLSGESLMQKHSATVHSKPDSHKHNQQ